MRSWRRTVTTIAASAGLLVLAGTAVVPAAVASARPTAATASPVDEALAGVSCMSATNCVAVGSTTSPGGQSSMLTEQWNGNVWRVLGQATAGALTGVSCVSSGCMAVGYNFDSPHGGSVSTAQWWNGSSWHSVNPSPGLGAFDEILSGVSCVSASDCVAVGTDVQGSEGDIADAVIAAWNGSSWHLTYPKTSGQYSLFNGVSCVTASSCLAVGFWNEGPNGFLPHALAEQWNGTSWTAASPPAPTGRELDAVSCPAAGDCMATGGAHKGWLAEQWKNGTWQPITISGGTNDVADGVSCPTTTNCTAVGSYAGNARDSHPALAEQWNGSSWQKMTPVSPGSLNSDLAAVSCTGPTSCVAAGNYQIPAESAELTLTEVRTGSTWQVPANPGYLVLQPDGGLSNFDVSWYGSPRSSLTGTAIGLAADAASGGYWVLTSKGGVDNYNAPWPGSEASDPNGTPVAIAADPRTGGYWILNSNGGVDNYGAPWSGSERGHVPGKAVAITADPKTGGYWILNSDGSVAGFNAPTHGSEAGDPNGTPAGITASPDGAGYWILNTNGGVDNYHVPWYGSARGHLTGTTATGITVDPATGGYWILASNGGVSNYHAPWYGSLAGTKLPAAPTAIAGL